MAVVQFRRGTYGATESLPCAALAFSLTFTILLLLDLLALRHPITLITEFDLFVFCTSIAMKRKTKNQHVILKCVSVPLLFDYTLDLLTINVSVAEV